MAATKAKNTENKTQSGKKTSGSKTASKTRTAAAKKVTKKKTASRKTSAAAGRKTSKKSTSAASVRRASAKTHTKNTETLASVFRLLKEILVIAAIAFCALLFVCCFQKPGSSFSWLQNGVFYLFGQASYTIPIFVLITICYMIVSYGSRGVWMRLTALLLFCISMCVLASLIASDGGIIGNTISQKILEPAFGRVGAYVVIVCLVIIGLVMFSGHSFVKAMRSNSQKAYHAVKSGQEIRRGEHEIRTRERELERERERSRRLLEQRRRLEELEAQREREITHRGEIELTPVHGITDVTLDPDDFEFVQESIHSKEETPYPQSEFMGEIHFGDEYAQEKETLTGQKEIRTTDALDESDSMDVKADSDESESMEKLLYGEESPYEEKLSYEQEVSYGEESPYGEELSYEQELPAEQELFSQQEPLYEQKLPDTPDMKNTYSNTSKRESMEENRTKTVRTASGKVITVELDGLPGENKRPTEVQKRKTKEEQEAVIVPKEYVEPKEYVFPPISYLKKGSSGGTSKEETSRRLKETAMKLQQTLQNFGVGVTVSNISYGPSVTRYELQPEQGVKVSRIVSLTDDIKLNLAAADIRMEAPIPGKAAIGIEVPNKEKQSVMLRDLLETDEFKKHPSKIVFAAGKDIGGSTILADIAKMPHLLIAGATGSGKSVCINTIIMSILYKAKPSEVKLIMIDPKVVELSIYNGIPHLMIPVVTDPKKAAGALNWAVTEMTDRYQKFAKYRVRDMNGYNEKVEAALKESQDSANGSAAKDSQDIPKKMPQIVIIVDELADLMMVAPGDVEDAICRLAQMARAAGIHLVIATQRPSVNVITGLIKANVPSRIAFSVSSGVDSRTIIDMNGAEKLLGKGDMLFYPSGYPKPLRVQGCFVSDEEVQEVVKFLSEQKNVIGGEQNDKIALDAPSGEQTGSEREVDEYFDKAARFIIEKDKASIGMLQRLFKIGFNRAARIMDQLAQAGVVSEEEGTKPRKVLMTMEEYENLQ